MIAFKITSMKIFMHHLLASDTFENFLFAEGVISTSHTYTIDGHVNKEFFDQTEASPAYDFATWSEMRPLCYDLIKGKRTPLYFKFVLHLKPEATSKLLAGGGSNVSAEQIKALVLTIKYDGSSAILTTGTAFHTFVMSKEPDNIWDKALQQFLDRENIPYELY